MSDFNIIVFLCNWGPHAAFQALQDQCADIPREIKMIRIPCSGRITKALLLRSFEMGADGVVLLGCQPGTCRYGSGTQSAHDNTSETRRILDLMGVGAQRLRLGNFLPDRPQDLLDFLQSFTRRIRELGRTPITRRPATRAGESPTLTPTAIVAAHDVFACQDCGKCTSACSLALAGKPYSPRDLANRIIAGQADDPDVRQAVNACLTCGVCYERCPSAVNFPEFIRSMRTYYHRRHLVEDPTHGGFFQSMMRAMNADDLAPRRWQDLPEKIRTQTNGQVLFFGGCAPYFDIFFSKFLGVQTARILEDSLRLLNFFDVEPVVLEHEVCCGHDLLWTGDRENFLRLARRNARAFADTGASELITACPECYRTLMHDYPEHGVTLPLTVTHMHAFLEREIDKGAVGFNPLGATVTFQDACRQSRFEGRSDLPRKLLTRMTGTQLVEMPESGRGAVCCGNSAWTGCDAYSKALQVKRITSARQTGSELMLTACPKCQIHLRCAMEDAMRAPALQMETMDLISAMAQTIYWEAS